MVWQDTANYRFAGIFASRTQDCRVAIDISPRRSHPVTDKNTTEEPSEELNRVTPPYVRSIICRVSGIVIQH